MNYLTILSLLGLAAIAAGLSSPSTPTGPAVNVVVVACLDDPDPVCTEVCGCEAESEEQGSDPQHGCFLWMAQGPAGGFIGSGCCNAGGGCFNEDCRWQVQSRKYVVVSGIGCGCVKGHILWDLGNLGTDQDDPAADVWSKWAPGGVLRVACGDEDLIHYTRVYCETATESILVSDTTYNDSCHLCTALIGD
jgi:hypothetical protein